MNAVDPEMRPYFSGERLYGEDLTPAELDAWLSSEASGFAELGAEDKAAYTYGYDAVNVLHGFRRIPPGRIGHVLGFGSAYGHELKPLSSRIDRITLLDASPAFVVGELEGRPVHYIPAERSGHIALPSGSVDLITCFGVLHHVPKVSTALAEFWRVLSPGGRALIREPITSMGDWRRRRPGLTRHERGLPIKLFESMLAKQGFLILNETPCFFPLTDRLGRVFSKPLWNTPSAVSLDAAMSRLFSWNVHYHRETLLSRIAPGHVFLVVGKPS